MNLPEKRSIVPLLLAFLAVTALLATLSFLTLGFAGIVVALALGLAVLIGIQYVVWGWWLTRFLQVRELNEDSRE